MSKYWNTLTKKITPYVPGEQPKDKKFIKLNTNENPYPPSPSVIKAIKNAANGDLRLYPDPSSTVFREVVAASYGVKSSQVFAGNGSDEILAFAFAAFFESGSEAAAILFPDITYSFYPVYADLWNVPYRTIALRDDFTINCDDYKNNNAASGCAGGVIFPNPNAPTGIETPINEILSLAEYLKEQGRVLIVDEAYIAFGKSSAYKYIEKYPNLLTVRTMSKAASLAGLRFGFAIGSEELIEGLCRIRDSFNSYTIDRLALAGATAAIKDAKYYNNINGKVIATRERAAKELSSMGFTVLPSSANFLFVKHEKISGADLFAKLREKGILVRHFNKEKIKDYLRITIGTDKQMDALLRVLCAFASQREAMPLREDF